MPVSRIRITIEAPSREAVTVMAPRDSVYFAAFPLELDLAGGDPGDIQQVPPMPPPSSWIGLYENVK